MTELVNVLPLFAAAAIALALILYIPVRSVFNYINAKDGRAYIVFKALASLLAWVIVSCGWLYMFIAMPYLTVSFENTLGEMRYIVSFILLDLLYAVIGCGLALWVRHKPRNGT